MNSNLTVFGILVGATLFFNVAMNYMGDNIQDFENRPLPPKKIQKVETDNPVLKVDATSRDAWTLVNFATGEMHQIGDPEKNRNELTRLNWDIGFQRTKVITNSGASNPQGGAGIHNLGAVDINRISKIPAASFTEDTRDWGNIRNASIADWYIYRTRTHNIESKKSVYLLRTHAGGHVKMRILNYYCQRPESDCRTEMCTRDEAACLTIEYGYAPPGQTHFPEPALIAAKSSTEPETP